MSNQPWNFLCKIASSVVLITAAVLSGSPDTHAAGFGRNKQIITGQVTFEKRATVVPMAICEKEPCAQSQTYWSVLVNSGGTIYELSQAFEVGRSIAPRSVAVAGVMVHPGVHVAIEGTVDVITPNYAIISEVNDARIISSSGSSQDAPQALISPVSYGWKCESDEPFDSKVYVEVYYTGEVNDEERYELKILANHSGEDIFYPVAEFEHATVKSQRGLVTYHASSSTASAVLVIDGSSDSATDLPAHLTLSHEQLGEWPLGAERIFSLRCNRTR
ncbi:MAG: hypothetical protein A2428_00085 [Bdellovibrionales bacterium RIFOXYC1_FULL_54_43]|nr:MAG: hypothetical protein A2428_00085 [Bdellovibrionales bacterium RIFOXYC1_FULL_54_43]OFZ81817.1 MAG: hypothetical protein A2603_06535 [Bdellovibrionales bacterium RIFOXYD1_FULL_55_31]